MKKRVLITGGSGLLAINCALRLRATHEVMLGLHSRAALEIAGVQARPIDMSTPAAVQQTLDVIRPDYVVHTAAATNVEQCEANPHMAREINVQLSLRVAEACAHAGCGLVHISTDHLFDGSCEWVGEEASVAPRNIYGVTKAEAEVAVRNACPGSLVIRTNFYGWGPPWRKSFSDGILASLRANQPIRLFADVYYTPILAAPLVTAIVDLIEGGHFGCFNVVGDERLSKFDFGVLLARTFGLDESLVVPSSIAEMPHLVERPREMSLSNEKVRRALGRSMGNTQEHLRCLLIQEQAGMKEELDGLDASGR